MGDPSGVGPEVLLKALSRFRPEASLTVIGDRRWLERTARRFSLKVPWSRFLIRHLASVPASLSAGKVQSGAGRAAHQCLEEAVRLLRAGEAEALVTAPVSKEAICRAGIPFVGHTETLGRAFHAQTTMMFVSGPFRVSLVTTHLALRDLPRMLTSERVVRALQATHRALARDFGIRSPRIGLAALNPHGGEGGLFGLEENRILLPAVRSCRFKVSGPHPVDVLMRNAMEGKYDAAVALYHDQALIPLKLIGWEKAVNVTLGLPFIRTSPAHGTAFDIAGKGKADHRSMLSAIELAVRLTRRRMR
ncbi:MAG: 4-hydroxythreonine-4-phosphate dehydrogenase PdxA [Candidatus Omnitrophica bacterium]|nr:4-hydroxythreonine-4-phosphate dehydrogenase PdxA [Candidatus Omnitrophota bacterium]